MLRKWFIFITLSGIHGTDGTGPFLLKRAALKFDPRNIQSRAGHLPMNEFMSEILR